MKYSPPPVRDSRRKLKGMLITDRLPTSRGGHIPPLLPSTLSALAQLTLWHACSLNTFNGCPPRCAHTGRNDHHNCLLTPSKHLHVRRASPQTKHVILRKDVSELRPDFFWGGRSGILCAAEHKLCIRFVGVLHTFHWFLHRTDFRSMALV